MLTAVLLLVFALMASVKGYTQTDIFKGIFEKEDASFFPTLTLSNQEGHVNLDLYFTHSKINTLEYSVWVKDLGTNMMGGGEKRMVQDLQEIGNREKKTIPIDGLINHHFYSIGIDYRNPQSLNRKFNAKVLQEGYAYEFKNQTGVVSAPNPSETLDQRPKSGISTTTNVLPCFEPDLVVKVEPSGYCGESNRPAVLVQCNNCQGKNWRFAVEAKTKYGDWQSLRADGQPQNALGVSVRTEPLCMVQPGMYNIQVLAWGQNCTTPIVKTVQTAIIIPDERMINNPPVVSAPATTAPAEDNYRRLPDTCEVNARASLTGNVIRGTIELQRNSPCSDMMPYASIKYVHPSYRDLTIEKINLIPGAVVPFEFELDSRDVMRGIHTLQVHTFVKSELTGEEVPMGSFWVKAEVGGQRESTYLAARDGASLPKQEGTPGVKETTPPAANQVQTDPYASSLDESLMEETINTVNVTASDPNCTPIQELQLVFDGARSTMPLYIAWLNPRCCQEEGCEYTVWAGSAPQQLRLLVKGRKSGALIRELLAGLYPNDQYFEVVVKTGNGQRKAAYVMGEGPIYGIEEIIAFHDKVNPKKVEAPDDEFTSVSVIPEGAVGGELMSRMPNAGAPVRPIYDIPTLPITNFEPCKYKRDVVVKAEQPIQVDDTVFISYGFKDKDYHYSLYFLPENEKEWVIAPGTAEFQSSPDFKLKMSSYHSGKYIVLSQKTSSSWGCLSTPVSEAIELNVVE